ncbi:MAG: hypothetical protein ACNYNX_06255 [Leucobacter sp.]
MSTSGSHSSSHLSILDPDGLDCILAAGDASDLRELRAWIADLPESSFGQIYIEVFSPIQIEPLPVPPGVGVTWICREALRPSSRPGIGIPRGRALADAVDAWLDEWVRVEDDAGRHFSIWTGARSSSVMQSFWLRIEAELAERWSGQPRSRRRA